MGSFTVIRPRDDAASRQASDWCDDLSADFQMKGHLLIQDVDDASPADRATIHGALAAGCDLICYFGHADENAWKTRNVDTVDTVNVSNASGKCVVSIACKSACNLGPDAITAGVTSWLGFTIKVPVIAPHYNVDPFGAAIVAGLGHLAGGRSMQSARDEIAANLVYLSITFDSGGPLHSHPASAFGYYAARCASDHVVVHGNQRKIPLP